MSDGAPFQSYGGGALAPRGGDHEQPLDPSRLVPRPGDPDAVIDAQVAFQNALWRAVLRPWPDAPFWTAFWRTLFPRWPEGKSWPPPKLEFIILGIQCTPDIDLLAVRDLRLKGTPHPTAVRLYTPEARWDSLTPRLRSLLSEQGSAWQWRTPHDPFPAALDPDELFVPSARNPMLDPVAHALAALQPSPAELAAMGGHWLGLLRGDSQRSGGSRAATPLLMDEADWDLEHNDADLRTRAASAVLARPLRRGAPSVSIRLDDASSSATFSSGAAAPGPVDENAMGRVAFDTDQLWEALRAKLTEARRSDEGALAGLGDQLVGFRRQVDADFDAQCAVPTTSDTWKRTEAFAWARHLAARRDAGKPVLPLLHLRREVSALTLEEHDAVEEAIKAVYTLISAQAPQLEVRLAVYLEMPQVLCDGLGHPAWLPGDAGVRRCIRCGKEERGPTPTAPVAHAAQSGAAATPQRSSLLNGGEDDWLR